MIFLQNLLFNDKILMIFFSVNTLFFCMYQAYAFILSRVNNKGANQIACIPGVGGGGGGG